jgi:hypothetical protein
MELPGLFGNLELRYFQLLELDSTACFKPYAWDGSLQKFAREDHLDDERSTLQK